MFLCVCAVLLPWQEKRLFCIRDEKDVKDGGTALSLMLEDRKAIGFGEDGRPRYFQIGRTPNRKFQMWEDDKSEAGSDTAL